MLASLTYCIYKGRRALSYHYHHCTISFVVVLDMSCKKQEVRVHEETLGEDKKRERRLSCSWRDCSCVMLGFSLVRC
jgi:hypothetical protein